MKTLTKPRPVRDEFRELSNAILAEREREMVRDGDIAKDCEHYRFGFFGGNCAATPLRAAVFYECPKTCPCFRRRAR
jgi:hypothetical protein